MIEPSAKSIARVLAYCKQYEGQSDDRVYEEAKLMLRKIRELTAAEYEAAIKQITRILFI